MVLCPELLFSCNIKLEVSGFTSQLVLKYKLPNLPVRYVKTKYVALVIFHSLELLAISGSVFIQILFVKYVLSQG